MCHLSKIWNLLHEFTKLYPGYHPWVFNGRFTVTNFTINIDNKNVGKYTIIHGSYGY